MEDLRPVGRGSREENPGNRLPGKQSYPSANARKINNRETVAGRGGEEGKRQARSRKKGAERRGEEESRKRETDRRWDGKASCFPIVQKCSRMYTALARTEKSA